MERPVSGIQAQCGKRYKRRCVSVKAMDYILHKS